MKIIAIYETLDCQNPGWREISELKSMIWEFAKSNLISPRWKEFKSVKWLRVITSIYLFYLIRKLHDIEDEVNEQLPLPSRD